MCFYELKCICVYEPSVAVFFVCDTTQVCVFMSSIHLCYMVVVLIFGLGFSLKAYSIQKK